MSAYHGVDRLELTRIRETGTPEEKKEAERKLAQDKVRAAEEDIQRQNGVRVPARLRQRPQVPAQQQMPNISSSMLEDLADELS